MAAMRGHAYITRTTSIVGFVFFGMVAGGCSDPKSASKTAFKSAAEKAIRDDVDATIIAGHATAKCDDPNSTEVGSTFACVGTAADGSTYFYSAKIVTGKNVTVNFVVVGNPAANDAPTGT